MNKIFLAQTIITFFYLLALFIVQNFKKFLHRILSYEDAPFLGPKWSICSKQILFWKIFNIILIYLLAPFIGQNLQKIISTDPELWGCQIEDTDIASFADDNTPYVIADNIDGVLWRSLRNFV